jgi:hypothetical protein
MNEKDLKNKLIEDIASIQDDVCLVMINSHFPEKSIFEITNLYDNLSNTWHTMKNIRIDLCFDVKKDYSPNLDIIVRDMTKEQFLNKVENIIKKLKNLVISLRDISNTEPRFFDLGYTPRNIEFAYQTNNAMLLMEDVKKIIG